jgi:hypothetical protein
MRTRDRAENAQLACEKSARVGAIFVRLSRYVRVAACTPRTIDPSSLACLILALLPQISKKHSNR